MTGRVCKRSANYAKRYRGAIERNARSRVLDRRLNLIELEAQERGTSHSSIPFAHAGGSDKSVNFELDDAPSREDGSFGGLYYANNPAV